MPRSPHGRPSKPGEDLDNMVKDYIMGLRVSSCAVNTRITMAAARWILFRKDKMLLSDKVLTKGRQTFVTPVTKFQWLGH